MLSKSRFWFFITSVILISSVFLSNSQITIVSSNEGQVVFPELNSINATSSTEYFNETSFPRYSLVGKPLTIIQSPHKGFPTIIETGETLFIETLADSDTTNWEFKLVSSTNNITVDIIVPIFDISTNLWQFQTEPEDYVPGLYDLQVNCSVGDDYQTHSVKIVDQKTYPFNILHISDAHFPSYDGKNTTAIDLEYIDYINTLDVDFAVFTGDLIEGGPATDFVNPETGLPLAAEVQIKLGLWAFDLIDLPIYYIGGNHDLDTSPLLPDIPSEVWVEYFGKNYMQFDYLNWSFIGYSCTRDGLSTEDFNKVNSLLSTEKDKPNVLFYHSDYQNHATSFRSNFKIEIMLYGHEHHEETYVTSSTLYHCEAPMFDNESSVITILNRTSASLEGIEYDFSSLLQTPTTKSSFSVFLILTLAPMLLTAKILKKRKAKRI